MIDRKEMLEVLEYTLLKDIIFRGLSQTGQMYYETAYKNLKSIQAALGGRGKFGEDVFKRFGERVFCYEFYHQMRLVFDQDSQRLTKIFKGAILQGEVSKMQIMELIDIFGLESLDREYVPDFLIHTPGKAAHHSCVIEVKCNPNLSMSDVYEDLEKINQFIIRYKYNFGFFISVNSSHARMHSLLVDLSDKILLLQGIDRITIVSKESQSSNEIIHNV